MHLRNGIDGSDYVVLDLLYCALNRLFGFVHCVITSELVSSCMLKVPSPCVCVI